MMCSSLDPLFMIAVIAKNVDSNPQVQESVLNKD